MMKKRMMLNICMVLVIIFTMACGIFAVGSVKGWFGNETETVEKTEAEDDAQEVQIKTENSKTRIYKTRNKTGIVVIERSGIAYEAEDDVKLRDKDLLYTKLAAGITVSDDDSQELFLGSNSKIQIIDAEKGIVSVQEGEVFVQTIEGHEPMNLVLDMAEVSAQDAVFTISSQAASNTIYVYGGTVTVEGEFFDVREVNAGNVISVLKKEDGTIEAETQTLVAEALNDGQIEQIRNYSGRKQICFSQEQLLQVMDDRREEKLAVQQAQLLKAETGEEQKEEVAEEVSNHEEESETVEQPSETVTQPTEEAVRETETETVEQQSEETEEVSVEEIVYGYCTITIQCDTILENMNQLKPEKTGYVPSDGVILTTSKVEFTEGETVFDVLKRACQRTDIPLEYSFTPLYNSYYIEGINHLYEFDCGDESGWMYKVNGWFPNYGCSSYELCDGDNIVWCYTCNGLGNDVGASGY